MSWNSNIRMIQKYKPVMLHAELFYFPFTIGNTFNISVKEWIKIKRTITFKLVTTTFQYVNIQN